MTKVIKNLNNKNIADYPLNILKGFSQRPKEFLAETALKDKDYAGLKNILSTMDYMGNILNEALDNLDVEAIKIIVEVASEFEYQKNGSYIHEYMIEDLFDENIITKYSFNKTEAFDKKIEILKILLNAKDKDQISLMDLQKLADNISQQEFEDFCKLKELDLTIKKFKDLELSQYKFSGLESVLNLEIEETTILSLLLSRTFSDKLTLPELKTIYTKLYQLSDISKEMLTYTAALISQGNTIKILFGEGTSSYYNKYLNIINIDNMFIGESIFNTESVVIHEIGHFVYEQIFKMKATPFNLSLIKSLVEDIYQENKEAIEDPFMGPTLAFKYTENEEIINLFKRAIEPVMSYESVARAPVDKAAELLLVDAQEYAKYRFTPEYTEYFKTHSYIDLFYLNTLSGLKTDKISSEIPDHIFNNILKIYLSAQDNCPYKTFLEEITREEIIKWAEKEFLAELVQELELSPMQVHFLDRIADYINRGDHLLSESYHYQNKGINIDDEKYIELIVRCSEFKASGLEKELTDTCQGLDSFHISHVSPNICTAIGATEVASMPFDIGMTGENYVCLSSEVF